MRSLIMVLCLVLMMSSFALVFVRHQNRIEFVQYRKLQRQHDDLQVKWRQLLVENRTLSLHQRVESTAREKLAMGMPSPDRTVVVDLQ